MRIYYFGELIADTTTSKKVPTPAKIAAKRSASEPRLIRDILTERPYAQKFIAATQTAPPVQKKRPSFLPSTFTVRSYSYA